MPYRLVGAIWCTIAIVVAYLLVVRIGAWWALTLAIFPVHIAINGIKTLITGLPPGAKEWTKKAERVSTTLCSKCCVLMSLSGTLHCQILAGITLRDEFLVKYGVLCAQHAEELGKEIVMARGLTDEEVLEVFSTAQQLIAEMTMRGFAR